MSLLWGEQKNWWLVSNEGEEDFKKIKSMFSHVLSVYVYGNPVTENEIESTENSSKWSTIPEWIENTNLEEESKFEEEFVPLDGTDILNIPENLKKLKVPCYCFYNKPMEADELQSRAEKYEVLKVVKNVDLECQVKITYSEWKNAYEQYVDVKDVEFFQHLGREQMCKKALRLRKSVERYNPDEEDIKHQEYKAVLKIS